MEWQGMLKHAPGVDTSVDAARTSACATKRTELLK